MMPFLFQQPQAEAAAAEEAQEAQEAQDEHDTSMTEQAEADNYARVANEGLEEYAADAEGEEVEEDAAEAATEGHDEEAAEADLQVLPHYEEAMREIGEKLGQPEGNGLLASEMDGLTCWLNDTAELYDNEYPESMQGDKGGEGCERGEGCEGCKGGGGLEAEEKVLEAEEAELEEMRTFLESIPEGDEAEAEEAELEDRRNFLESIAEGDEAEGEDADTEAPSDEAIPGVSMAVNKRCEHSIEKDAAPEEIEEEEGEAPTVMARHPWDGKPLPTDAEEAPEEEAAEATAEEAPEEEEEAPEAQGEICSS